MKKLEDPILLSLTDKFEIFEIEDIKDDFILCKNEKILILEYLSSVEKPIFRDFIRNKNIHYQVKIIKERLSEAKEEILGSQWIDFSSIQNKLKDGSPIFNDHDRKQLEERSITAEEIDTYTDNHFIYRHYLILPVPEFSEYSFQVDIEKELHDIYINVANSNVLVRRLKNPDLYTYLQKVFTDTNKLRLEKRGTTIAGISEDLDENLFVKIFFAIKSINTYFWEKIGQIGYSLEYLLFHKNIPNFSTKIMDLYKTKMKKGLSYFQIGETYYGGSIIRGIPKQEFNIILSLLSSLEAGDWITINIYPEEYHNIEFNQESEGLSLFKKEEVSDKKEEKEALKLVITMGEISPTLLERKITNYGLAVGTDFYIETLNGSISRFYSNSIGIGKNTHSLERFFSSNRIKTNIFF